MAKIFIKELMFGKAKLLVRIWECWDSHIAVGNKNLYGYFVILVGRIY